MSTSCILTLPFLIKNSGAPVCQTNCKWQLMKESFSWSIQYSSEIVRAFLWQIQHFIQFPDKPEGETVFRRNSLWNKRKNLKAHVMLQQRGEKSKFLAECWEYQWLRENSPLPCVTTYQMEKTKPMHGKPNAMSLSWLANKLQAWWMFQGVWPFCGDQDKTFL